MFSSMDSSVIEAIHSSFGGDAIQTIDYIVQNIMPTLTQQQLQLQSSPSYEQELADRGSRVSSDSLAQLPDDVLHHVCSFLDLYSQSRLKCASKGCYDIIEHAHAQVRYLNVGKFRSWRDDRICSLIRQFPQLNTISLQNCFHFDNFPSLASVCPQTTTKLVLSGCKELTDSDVAMLFAFVPSIVDLDLSKTLISDACLEAMGDAQVPLRSLKVSDCPHISRNGISRLLRRVHTLEHLDISLSSFAEKEIVLDSNSAPSLRSLVLNKCSKLTRLVIEGSASRLEEVSLSHCANLTHLSVYAPNLHRVHAPSCKQLTRLLVDAPCLVTLNLSMCRNLQHLDNIAEMHTLSSFNVFQCRSLQSEAIEALCLTSALSLRSVRASGCLDLRDSTTNNMLESCLKLVEFDVSGCPYIQRETLAILSSQLSLHQREAAEAAERETVMMRDVVVPACK